ncbi:hypothetical protein IFT69_13775 [Pseudomonas putida]|nr:hypothetical protein [Pseudomonas putida]
MTALNHFRHAETDAWERLLPEDNSIIAQGLLKKSPFPIIDLVRSRKYDELLLKLCLGSDLRIQRKAWSEVAIAATHLSTPPHWLASGFDEVITKLCFPNLRFALVQNDLKCRVKYGRSITCDQVLQAWSRIPDYQPQSSGSKTHEGVWDNQTKSMRTLQQIALHHLWLESHPQRDIFTPDLLGEGQIVMMAFSEPSSFWRQQLAQKARDILLAVDLGL